MKIISVDPGYDRCGVAILESEPKENLTFSTCINTDKKDDFENRLFKVGEGVQKIIDEFSPKHLAIENLFMSNNQKTVMRVSEVRGMIIYIAKKNNLEIFEYTPLQIKTALTGHGKSDKSQVGFMVEKILGQDFNDKIDDELDAIACGLTHLAYFH